MLHLGAGNLYGGIETLLVTLARERSSCPEMVPEFGLCFEGRLSEELRSAGVKVHVFRKVRFSRPWSVWLARRRLRQLLRVDRPDAVVTHACWPHALFAPAVRTTAVPLVFWAHDAAHPEHWLDGKASRVPPDRVIANSHWTANSLEALFPRVSVEVVYYPGQPVAGNVHRREALRREFCRNAGNDAVVILIACRMEEWKGHRTLLEALGALKSNPHWACWIAGGAQREKEQEYVRQLHHCEASLGLNGRIRWLGQRNDVPDLLAAADIYCQPNLGPEPFGLVFLESLFSSKPVVSTRQGGAMEIIDDSCGLLVEPGCLADLTGVLARLIENPELRTSLGVRGPTRARCLCDAPEQLRKLLRQIELARPALAT